ncbi:Gfo/Idh/MocA family protein [Aquihabitans daechungensis]|uniref:Gfo/Idh/MocA family protein n=1 Tax=Aquihabitans daechungensis TaxID=1052257 RepID=UPI003BA2FA24
MAGIRFGVLGAARIAPQAIIKPAAASADASVVAVAARDRAKAEAFAKKHDIAHVHDSYAALIADPEIDAIYNPLPNGLHGEWTIAALDAGKHVLCEKPFTSNAEEARQVKAVADAHPDLVVMEAFHYRYHPFADRLREIVQSGELGAVQRVETAMCFPLPRFGDIRYDYDLAGGATMDVGCYTIHCLRLLAGEEPEVVSAEAKLKGPKIDRAMVAEMVFPSGATGRIHCSMWSSSILKLGARVVGDKGEMKVRNFTMPHLFGKVTVSTEAGSRSEVASKDRTYVRQLDAFCGAVLHGGPNLTPPSDSITTMEIIDAVYTAAGLPLRGIG